MAIKRIRMLFLTVIALTIALAMLSDAMGPSGGHSDTPKQHTAGSSKILNALLSEGNLKGLLEHRSDLPNTAAVRAVVAVRVCALSKGTCGRMIRAAWPRSVKQMEEIYNATELPNNEFPSLGAAHDHFYELGEHLAERGQLNPAQFLRVMAEFGTEENVDEEESNFTDLVNAFRKRCPKKFAKTVRELTSSERNSIQMYEDEAPQ